ncbi:MAG: hypothetical protein N0A00_10070 [Candidatus Bathyarchaeota archaeon]|nr:hypothetical protein [Candidatus Bathyarchaeota archaeon]
MPASGGQPSSSHGAVNAFTVRVGPPPEMRAAQFFTKIDVKASKQI